MVTQISPAGGLTLPLGGVPQPAAARPAPASNPGAKAVGSIDVAVAQVNQHLQQADTQMKLQVDSGSGRTVFQIIQQGTGAVVLQVPSAEVLGMSRRIRELEGQSRASGALVDKEG